MAVMTHAKFHFNWFMLTLSFGIWASEPPGPGERLKRPGLIGLNYQQNQKPVLKIISGFNNFGMKISGRLLLIFSNGITI